MTEIYERIINDRNSYQKNRDLLALGSCKIILGEISRDPNKDKSDKNVIKILKSLRKMTLKSPIADPLLVSMIDIYIPPIVSDRTVLGWIKSKYTFEDIVNKGKKAMSIIGEVKNNFSGRDINAVCIKNFINDAQNDDLEEGRKSYEIADKPPVIDVNVDPDLFKELIDDLTKRKSDDD